MYGEDQHKDKEYDHHYLRNLLDSVLKPDYHNACCYEKSKSGKYNLKGRGCCKS